MDIININKYVRKMYLDKTININVKRKSVTRITVKTNSNVINKSACPFYDKITSGKIYSS